MSDPTTTTQGRQPVHLALPAPDRIYAPGEVPPLACGTKVALRWATSAAHVTCSACLDQVDAMREEP